MPATEQRRLLEALAAIDAANAEDPERIVVDGVGRPKELVHAERATHWLHRLVEEPSPQQRLAVRAHHLRRWELPRDAYDEGRAGYHRWRSEQKRRHAVAVTDLLAEVGYDDSVTTRVADLVAKRTPSGDPDAQAHEDALCLVFLELQLDEIASRLGDDKTVAVLKKTLPKMSPQAVEMAAEVGLSDRGRALLHRAVAERSADQPAEESGDGTAG